MKSIYIYFILVSVLVSCSGDDKSSVQPSELPEANNLINEEENEDTYKYNGFSKGVEKGILDNNEINEASGIVPSFLYNNMFWVTNDSGDQTRLFLINDNAEHKLTVVLEGINAYDTEDLSMGPGPISGANYIYIADVGDNSTNRTSVKIYRIKEPLTTLGDAPSEIVIDKSDVDIIEYQYPEGPRDCEAVMVDPSTGDIFIITKSDNPVNLYVLPYPQATSSINSATFLRTLPFFIITAGDISYNGREVLIKNYVAVYHWVKGIDEPYENIFNRTPNQVSYTIERQGESICFDLNLNFYTVSEANNETEPTTMPPLMYYESK